MSNYLEPSDVAVIIINYGTAKLTIDAIESVLKYYSNDASLKIHVVDNASPGDDAAVLTQACSVRDWGTQVTLHLETINHGFGRGNNLVLKQLVACDTQPKFVFLLNSDAALKNDAIKILRQFLEQTPKAGVVGAGIAKPDGTAVTAAFKFPNIIAEFAQCLSFGPVARLCRSWCVPLDPDHPKARVDWVAGAAVMMRMRTIMQIDFFDSAFFLYFEEVDLMRKASLDGWETWYVPEACVMHAEGASTGVKSGRCDRHRRPAYWYYSWQYYYRKNHGRFGALLAAMAFLTGTAGNILISWMRGRTSQAPRFVFRDFYRFALQPLLGNGLTRHE